MADWEQVYSTQSFTEFATDSLAHLKDGIYYLTFGGGPEGGYVCLPNGDVYSVSRNWGQPFTVTKETKRFEKRIDEGVLEVRLVNDL